MAAWPEGSRSRAFWRFGLSLKGNGRAADVFPEPIGWNLCPASAAAVPPVVRTRDAPKRLNRQQPARQTDWLK